MKSSKTAKSVNRPANTGDIQNATSSYVTNELNRIRTTLAPTMTEWYLANINNKHKIYK